MPYGIVGVVYAALYSLVTHVHGIVTCFWYRGLIGDTAQVLVTLFRLCHTGRTSPERILLIHIDTWVESKALQVCLLPSVTADFLLITALRRVVVYDHLVALPVSLSGHEHDGPSLLQHGYQVGCNDSRSEQVFTGSE